MPNQKSKLIGPLDVLNVRFPAEQSLKTWYFPVSVCWRVTLPLLFEVCVIVKTLGLVIVPRCGLRLGLAVAPRLALKRPADTNGCDSWFLLNFDPANVESANVFEEKVHVPTRASRGFCFVVVDADWR